MKLERTPDAESAGRKAAAVLAGAARAALEGRDDVTLALSGGTTPEPMFRALAEADLDWRRIHIFQVDERVAPSGDPERNWTHIVAGLLSRVPIPEENAHPMPVEAGDLEAGAREYATLLRDIAGNPPRLDAVHLGLGADGHTASLIPGDLILDETTRDVAVTTPYQGRRRMSLTFPALARARRIVWLVSGAGKAPVLARLLRGDRTIPAGRLPREHAVVIADAAASEPTAPTGPQD